MQIAVRTDAALPLSAGEIVLFGVIALLYGLFNYFPYVFAASAVTAGGLFPAVLFFAIVIPARKYYRNDFAAKTGLSIPPKQIVLYLVCAALSAALMYRYMVYIAWEHDLQYVHALEYPYNMLALWYPPRPVMFVVNNLLYHLFQTLNDEIVIGALVLFTAERLCKRKAGVLYASVLAMVFSAGHYVFFEYIAAHRGTLQFTALISLFFAGFVRNYLILLTRSVYASWALHALWNSLLFSGYFFSYADNGFLQRDVERLNIVMGDLRTLAAFALVALVLVSARGGYDRLNLKPRKTVFSEDQ